MAGVKCLGPERRGTGNAWPQALRVVRGAFVQGAVEPASPGHSRRPLGG